MSEYFQPSFKFTPAAEPSRNAAHRLVAHAGIHRLEFLPVLKQVFTKGLRQASKIKAVKILSRYGRTAHIPYNLRVHSNSCNVSHKVSGAALNGNGVLVVRRITAHRTGCTNVIPMNC